MKIGMIGLGKLGLPVALAIESKGHTVIGHDINPVVREYLETRHIPYKEDGIEPLLGTTGITLKPVDDIVKEADIIFVAIQTPHDPQFEGATRLPEERRDFDYSHLLQGIRAVAQSAKKQQKQTTLVVISTCLPGTFKRDIEPILNEYVNYVYNPFFIAMGTVVHDFLNPEFVLIGCQNYDRTKDIRTDEHEDKLLSLYEDIGDRNYKYMITDITTAEAIKVSYNTFITMKTILGNTWGEIAHKVGANVDDIYKAWSMATDRLISPKYLKSGVGDGGGCHPRDNIALSYLAREINLSHNIFEDLIKSRENHMAWIAKEASVLASKHKMPLVVLGKSFKPETNIETGSPAVLLSNILKEYGQPHEHTEDITITTPAVFVIATQHERYKTYDFPEGSVVLDPFRYIEPRDTITVIPIGK